MHRLHSHFKVGSPPLPGWSIIDNLQSISVKKGGTHSTICHSDKWVRRWMSRGHGSFREEDFLVGVSLDGYESNTNRFRVDQEGKGMYAQIMQGIRLLEQYEVAYNILTVLTPRLAAHPEAYYHS